MPEKTSYEPGAPCWVDLVTPDLAAAGAFYTGLFGWHAHAGDGERGHTLLSLDGDPARPVAAMMLHVPEAPPGTPALWTTYVSVADVDAAAGAAAAAGGRVFLGPMEVPGMGRFAMVFDPQGAHLGLWQPGGFTGAAVVDETAAYTWSELATRDPEGAAAFYGATLGWRGAGYAFEGTAYTEWKTSAGSPVAGMVRMDGRWPAEARPYWAVYFAVADCDAAARRAAELGGAVLLPPADLPVGRFAVLADPQGGLFSVMQPPS
ncbi:VOC family protein [Spirillospora sp. CA-253888]